MPPIFLISRRLLIPWQPLNWSHSFWPLGDYGSFVISILTHLDPYTIEEIEALLLSQEESLEKYKIIDYAVINITVISGPNNSYINKSSQYSLRNNRSTNHNNSSFKRINDQQHKELYKKLLVTTKITVSNLQQVWSNCHNLLAKVWTWLSTFHLC